MPTHAEENVTRLSTEVNALSRSFYRTLSGLWRSAVVLLALGRMDFLKPAAALVGPWMDFGWIEILLGI